MSMNPTYLSVTNRYLEHDVEEDDVEKQFEFQSRVDDKLNRIKFLTLPSDFFLVLLLTI